MERFISGESKENLQSPLPQSIHWSDDRWKACLAVGGGAKKRFQYCADDSGILVYLRALQGHSGRNLIDHPSLQYCFDSEQFLPIYFTILDVFLNKQWIDTWRSEFKQETNSVLLAC